MEQLNEMPVPQPLAEIPVAEKEPVVAPSAEAAAPPEAALVPETHIGKIPPLREAAEDWLKEVQDTKDKYMLALESVNSVRDAISKTLDEEYRKETPDEKLIADLEAMFLEAEKSQERLSVDIDAVLEKAREIKDSITRKWPGNQPA